MYSVAEHVIDLSTLLDSLTRFLFRIIDIRSAASSCLHYDGIYPSRVSKRCRLKHRIRQDIAARCSFQPDGVLG